MIKIKLEALDRVMGIAWEDNPDAEFLLQQIQSVLYELDQMLDAKSDQMYGDPDAHVNSPNFRRI